MGVTDEIKSQDGAGATESGSAVRYCRYGRCRRPLPSVDRPGRKPEYCTDRTWPPDNKSCKEMAQAEARAERATGLDVPLAAYQLATERLVPAVTDLRGRLDAVLATVGEVGEGALGRIAEAETAMAAAVERAQTAEAQAARDAAKRADAERHARQDREAKMVAVRQARDAEREKERSVNDAWRKVVDAEAAQGKAEGQAAEATANLRAYIERFDRLAGDHDALLKTNKQLSRDNGKLETTLKATETAAAKAAEQAAAETQDLREQLGQARQAAARAAAEHAAALDDAHTRLATETTARAAAERERDQAQARVDQLQGQTDQLRDELGAARGRADAADSEITRLREENTQLHQRFGVVDIELADLRRQLEEATKARHAPPGPQEVSHDLT